MTLRKDTYYFSFGKIKSSSELTININNILWWSKNNIVGTSTISNNFIESSIFE